MRINKLSLPQGSVPVILSMCLLASGAGLMGTDVHTVPLNPNNVLIPHDIISGNPTTLKAAADEAYIGEDWSWLPGDGSGTCNGSATSGNIDANPGSITVLDDIGYNPYWALWCQHTYTGSVGDVFIATITVDTDGSSGGPFTDTYRVQIQNDTLPVEVNAAIDEGLWFMHRNQFRFDGTATGGTSGTIPMGRWDFPQTFATIENTTTASAVNAFEANGYFETGPATSPYTETVDRGLKYVFSRLATRNSVVQTAFPLPPDVARSDDPDSNGNGLLIYSLGGDEYYQGGMVIDAIVASGTPGVCPGGPGCTTTGPAGVLGRTYAGVVQDYVDNYAYGQTDNVNYGGWRYSPYNNSSGSTDNSTNGWAGIGLEAAETLFGAIVPPWVKTRNINSLEFTDTESNVSTNDGFHGYTSTGAIWGGTGTATAALVQQSWQDIASTTDPTPDERWIRSENYVRRRFNEAISGNNLKNYYYGMFNFAKAMRTAHPSPVIVIGTEVGNAEGGIGCGPSASCAANGPQPVDWYNAENGVAGATIDGLARVVVDQQVKSGVNIGQFPQRSHSGASSQGDHQTQWGVQILTRTLFEPGPVAQAEASPNQTAEGIDVDFDPSDSFHQDPAKNIVKYEWDFDDDGVFDVTTLTPDIVMESFFCDPPGAVPCSILVTLRVMDDSDPQQSATDSVIVEITIPPHPPTADANGPYLTCVNEDTKLNGDGSFDVDEGESESGDPPFDTITAWDWDLDLASGAPFDVIGATGAMPDPTLVHFGSLGVTDIALRVTDKSAAAFPTAQSPDLTDSDSTTVSVGDCSCIDDISVRSKSTKNQLVWTPVPGAASYDIWRSTEGPSSGFSTIAAGVVTSFATYLDSGLTNGVTYWYRVVPKDGNGDPICDHSRAASGMPAARGRR